MSTHIESLAAPAAGSSASEPSRNYIGTLISGWIGRWQEVVRLRHTLGEIKRLGDHELTDIGLTHDEISRLRRNELFLPDSWRNVSVMRGELPF